MRKQLLYVFLAFVYIWSWSIFNVLNANERVQNTTGHIIVETVKGTDIDQMKVLEGELQNLAHKFALEIIPIICLLYTSDAADDLLCVDLGGRRIIKKFLPCIKTVSYTHLRAHET